MTLRSICQSNTVRCLQACSKSEVPGVNELYNINQWWHSVHRADSAESHLNFLQSSVWSWGGDSTRQAVAFRAATAAKVCRYLSDLNYERLRFVLDVSTECMFAYVISFQKLDFPEIVSLLGSRNVSVDHQWSSVILPHCCSGLIIQNNKTSILEHIAVDLDCCGPVSWQRLALQLSTNKKLN